MPRRPRCTHHHDASHISATCPGKPHFELVADILIWLCNRYDKNMEILDEIRTEQNRVVFLKSVAEQLLVKARVKLNLKNLYQANGYAVKELLKVCAPARTASPRRPCCSRLCTSDEYAAACPAAEPCSASPLPT